MTDDQLLGFVRRHDPDRFLTLLFAPPERRAALAALYAFNHELARAREVAREPMVALMRLQWWREVVDQPKEGQRRAHEVAMPLAAALAAGALARSDLLVMIAGREVEAEPAIPDRVAWIGYLRATGGALAAAAGRALGGEGAVLERLATLGAAYAVAGGLRNVRALARQGRCLLPEDLLAAHGLGVHGAIADPTDARLGPVLAAAAAVGRGWLAEAGGRVPRPLLAAALPAVLARRDLRRPAAAAVERGLGDRLAVVRAAITGRV